MVIFMLYCIVYLWTFIWPWSHQRASESWQKTLLKFRGCPWYSMRQKTDPFGFEREKVNTKTNTKKYGEKKKVLPRNGLDHHRRRYIVSRIEKKKKREKGAYMKQWILKLEFAGKIETPPLPLSLSSENEQTVHAVYNREERKDG